MLDFLLRGTKTSTSRSPSPETHDSTAIGRRRSRWQQPRGEPKQPYVTLATLPEPDHDVRRADKDALRPRAICYILAASVRIYIDEAGGSLPNRLGNPSSRSSWFWWFLLRSRSNFLMRIF